MNLIITINLISEYLSTNPVSIMSCTSQFVQTKSYFNYVKIQNVCINSTYLHCLLMHTHNHNHTHTRHTPVHKHTHIFIRLYPHLRMFT